MIQLPTAHSPLNHLSVNQMPHGIPSRNSPQSQLKKGAPAKRRGRASNLYQAISQPTTSRDTRHDTSNHDQSSSQSRSPLLLSRTRKTPEHSSNRVRRSSRSQDDGSDQPMVPGRRVGQPKTLLSPRYEHSISSSPVSLVPTSSLSSASSDEDESTVDGAFVYNHNGQKIVHVESNEINHDKSKNSHGPGNDSYEGESVDSEEDDSVSTSTETSTESSRDEDDSTIEGAFGNRNVRVESNDTTNDHRQWSNGVDNDSYEEESVDSEEEDSVTASPTATPVKQQDLRSAFRSTPREHSSEFEALWARDHEMPNSKVAVSMDHANDADCPTIREDTDVPLNIVVNIIESEVESIRSSITAVLEEDEVPEAPMLDSQSPPQERRVACSRPKQYKIKTPPAHKTSFLEGNLSKMGTDYFGQRPRFVESKTGGKQLSMTSNRDPRKVIDKHLRTLGTAVGQSLSLNTRNACYFYFEDLLVNVHIPKDDENVFVISSTVHQAVPAQDSNVILQDMIKSEYFGRDAEMPTITMKNQLQLNVSCTVGVQQTYVEFKKCMKEFRDMVMGMKERIRASKFQNTQCIR